MCSLHEDASQEGYTLIELVMVVVLLALLSAFFVSRFSFNTSWSVDSSLREIRNKIEFVMQDSNSRQVSYQIEFDLMNNSYQVWEVRTLGTGEIQQVDTLSGLRSRKQKERRAERDSLKGNESLDQEIMRSILDDARPLDELLYQRVFDDPFGASRRILSLEYPSISEKVYLPPEIQIEEVYINQIPAPALFDRDSRVIFITPAINNLQITILLQTEKGKTRIESDPLSNSINIYHVS